MKKRNTLLSLFAAGCLLGGIYSCGDTGDHSDPNSGDRITGNEEAAHVGPDQFRDTNSTTPATPDTVVTGVSGNRNAVNADGNAGNGSGLGATSITGAEQNTKPGAQSKETNKEKKKN